MFSRSFFLLPVLLVILVTPNTAFAARNSKKKEEVVPYYEGRNSYIFVPPKKWQCIDDRGGLPAKVDVVFVGQAKKGFTPSINIATEKTNMTLEQYVGLAKKYHESQAETVCYNIGPLQTKSEPSLLLQINKRTQWGNVRFLQAAVIKDKLAYVITATCLEEDFANYYPQFLESFQSFCLKSIEPQRVP